MYLDWKIKVIYNPVFQSWPNSSVFWKLSKWSIQKHSCGWIAHVVRWLNFYPKLSISFFLIHFSHTTSTRENMMCHLLSCVYDSPAFPGAGGANVPAGERGQDSFAVEHSGSARLWGKCKNSPQPPSSDPGCVCLARSQVGWCFCVMWRVQRVRMIASPFLGTNKKTWEIFKVFCPHLESIIAARMVMNFFL